MPDPQNVVIDISPHNANLDFQQAGAEGIVGEIHKATQGLTYKDPMEVVCDDVGSGHMNERERRKPQKSRPSEIARN